MCEMASFCPWNLIEFAGHDSLIMYNHFRNGANDSKDTVLLQRITVTVYISCEHKASYE